MNLPNAVSVVIPAKNESQSIGEVVDALLTLLPEAEILVIDDGSTDETGAIARKSGANVVRHPTSRGNGAAIKSGIRAASRDVIVCMDGDGQHQASDVPLLLDRLAEGYDLVVGARSKGAQANWWRGLANRFYNKLASWMTGHQIDDLTSGFRAMRRDKIMEFLSLLPNGFSYPTTSTMAFYRGGYGVAFEGINVARRKNESGSHINIWKDGGRFLLIIFRIAVLYSPLKVFFPAALTFFASGIAYYLYTFFTDGRFTNFGALLLTTSVLIFLIGLVSEQITTLTYLASKQGRQSHD
ncbi:MAG: glycosyl transferase [Xanthomonadales bacterium]|nr:glycosyl transferase [Xanthomonadales bacterium]